MHASPGSRVCQGLVFGLTLTMACFQSASGEPEIQRNIEFARRGERSLKADVYLPAGEGPFPAVLMVHGGGWMSGSKLQVHRNAFSAAKRGYVVVAINYRLAPKHKFPAQIDDCHAALRWMRANAGRYRIDGQRIAGFGYSAGGHLVSLMGMKHAETENDRLQAIVAGGAPNEFRDLPEDSDVLKYWLGGNRAELPAVYRDASPRSFVSADDPPVFLYHGDRDRLVATAACEGLYRQLQLNGVRAEKHIVREAGHLKAFFDREATEKALDFLDDVLKPSSQE